MGGEEWGCCSNKVLSPGVIISAHHAVFILALASVAIVHTSTACKQMSASAPPVGGNENRAIELITVSWSLCVISVVLVGLRLYSRIRITRNLWWDDYFIIVTAVGGVKRKNRKSRLSNKTNIHDQMLAIIFSSFWTVLGVNEGCRHLYYLTHDQISLVTKINWMSQPFAIMALATGKISVAFFILRIIGRSTWRRAFLYLNMITCFVFCALAAIFSFVQCSPPKALWTPSIKGKCWKPESQSNFSVFVGSEFQYIIVKIYHCKMYHCKIYHCKIEMMTARFFCFVLETGQIIENSTVAFYTDKAIGWLAFTDVALALLPITIIQNLQLSIKKKLGLCALMGLGIL